MPTKWHESRTVQGASIGGIALVLAAVIAGLFSHFDRDRYPPIEIKNLTPTGPLDLGQPPMFYPVSNGKTAEEAIDRAIERYNRKHGIMPTAVRCDRCGVVQLPFRGWVET